MRHEALIKAREAAGLTQAQLAEAAGTNLRTIQSYEQGLRSINKAAALSVYKMAKILGCTVEELLLIDYTESE